MGMILLRKRLKQGIGDLGVSVEKKLVVITGVKVGEVGSLLSLLLVTSAIQFRNR